MKTMVTRDQFITEIRRIAEKYGGKPPGRSSFESESGFPKSNWEGIFWSKWSDALIEAGFEPNQRFSKIEDEMIFEKLIPLCRHFKRVPTVPDMRIYRRTIDSEFPISAIRKRFGAEDLWSEFANWLKNQTGNFNDVSELIDRSMSKATTDSDSAVVGASLALGYVYLMKSGDHYKIGKSGRSAVY